MITDIHKVGFLALFAAPMLISASSTPDDAKPTVLTVSGQGYSAQSSEIMTVRAGSSQFSKYAGRAVRDNAAVLERLRDELDDNGIDRRDVTTGGFRLNEGRDPADNDRDRDRGYLVSQDLIVFVRNPDNAGKVIDALVEAGADGVTVSRSHGYGEVTRPEVEKKARNAAVKDARQKAKDYADAIGMKIIRVATVRDGGVHMSNRPAPAALAVSADVPTQIDNGERSVVASVSVEFELAPR